MGALMVDLSAAIEVMKQIESAQRKLNGALTPGGTEADEITVTLTKMEIATLLVCINRVAS
jgi:hypothetical protein